MRYSTGMNTGHHHRVYRHRRTAYDSFPPSLSVSLFGDGLQCRRPQRAEEATTTSLISPCITATCVFALPSLQSFAATGLMREQATLPSTFHPHHGQGKLGLGYHEDCRHFDTNNRLDHQLDGLGWQGRSTIRPPKLPIRYVYVSLFHTF